MEILKIVVLILTFVHVKCNESDKQSSYDNLQKISLNQGEYIPTGEELRRYDTQYKDNNEYNIPQSQNTKFLVIKRAKPIITKRMMVVPRSLPTSVSYAAIHQTKIMPVNVIQEGPIRHVYLPENNIPAPQLKTVRTPKAYGYFNKFPYNSGQYQQFYGRSPAKYSNSYFQPSFGIPRRYVKDNIVSNGYRYGKNLVPNYIPNRFPTGHENNVYSSNTQFVPQSFSDLSSKFTNEKFSQPTNNLKYSQNYLDQYKTAVNGFDNNKFLSLVNNVQPSNSESESQPTNNLKYSQNYLDQYKTAVNGFDNNKFVSPVNNVQPGNSESEFTNFQSSDSELTNIVNDVINNGKGIPTHDGFTMIKSKTDNAIYLIGKPGMSLSTLPNFSAYNYDFFKNSEEKNASETEENTSP